jgi:flavin reductase (DIM6/NTAB) family NADH-FMN oxidoreductase RutF
MNESADYRRALGAFATGVTVVTSCMGKRPIGLTVNSFSSVSLNPRIVLWNLRLSSPLLSAFQDCEYFAVNILSGRQRHLSQRFATKDIDRFEGVRTLEGLGGIPVILECVAVFECRRHQTYYAGDHALFLGQVDRFSAEIEEHPLVLWRGDFFAPRGEPPYSAANCPPTLLTSLRCRADSEPQNPSR